MIEVIGILAICYLLIGMEAIVPGGILGILGFAGLFVAAYFAYMEFDNWFAPSLTFLLGGFGAIFLVFAEFKWLAKSSLGKRLFLAEAVSGFSNKEVAKSEIVGKVGITITDCHPEGRVEVEGDYYDAASDSGMLAKGIEIKVVAVENFRIRVRTQ
jgi:membrane-bound serine protease (ClpP class)